MSKKFMSFMLIGLVLNLFFYTAAHANNAEKEAKFARKVKSEIARLGSGPQTSVKVKLLDNSKLKGYIGEIGEDSFTIVDKQTNNATTIQYSKVRKASGANHLSGHKILIGIGIALVVLMVISFAAGDDY